MSSALKCDRCGKLYEHREITDNFISDRRMRYAVMKDCHPQDMVVFDLCRDCRISLVEWFNKGGDT